MAAIEAVAIGVFAIALGIASFNTRGTNTGASPVAEVVIYLLFAAGVGLIARGLWRRNRLARTPMVLAQVFGLISAWLFWEGDGVARIAGVVIAVVCVLRRGSGGLRSRPLRRPRPSPRAGCRGL